VHGLILARYLELGGKGFGYPVTDESGTKDGRARFNDFRELPGGAEKSIYWTAGPTAVEVFGLIRQAWLSHPDRNSLGYPTTGELLTHDNTGRYQLFENAPISGIPTPVRTR